MGIDATLRFKLKKGAEVPRLNGEAKIEPFDGEIHTHQVELYQRLYEIGYARGNFPYILSIVLELKANPNVTQIEYGGEFSEYFHEPMTMKRINKLMSHWCKYGNTPWLEA